jgi:P4 family phage/plasmid primase-like protien
MPLIRSGVPGAQGWLDGSGTFLAGPYAGSRMLDWALAYADKGWHVFQMRQGTKSFFGNCTRCRSSHPDYDAEAHAGGSEHCTVHPEGYGRCHGLWSATTNPDVIRHWWTENPHGNIGINCGRSGIACIDVDIKHHQGKYGDTSITALEAKHGAFPAGPRAVTASGGWHWVFELPEDHELRSSTGFTDAKGRKHGLGDHVDIKAVGGLMVAAPSLVYDDTKGIVTGQYTWQDSGTTTIPELPRWVVGEIAEREKKQQPRAFTMPSFLSQPAADRDEVLEQVNRLADEVAQTTAGGRNDLLLRNAKKAFQYAEAGQISHNEVQFIFEQATLASGMDQSDFHTIDNAKGYARGKPYTYTKRLGGTEAREIYNAWRPPVPPQAAPQHDEITEAAGVTVLTTTEEEEGEEGSALIDTAVYGNGAQDGGNTGGPGGNDTPSADRLFLDEVRDYEPNHLGQARYFCDVDGAKLTLRWNLSAGTFMKYDLERGFWRQDDNKHTLTGSDLSQLGIRITDATNREIKFSPEMELISRSFKEKIPKEKVAQAKAIITAKKAWPKLYGAAAGVQGILTFTRTLVDQCTALDFDRTSGLLNFANGTYDVTTGQMRAHSMNDMLTHQVPHELDMTLAEKPLNEVAPHFHKLITRMCAAPGEVSQDVHDKRVAAVLRLLGYSLHGSNPEKKMAALVGGTNIGKNQAVEVVGMLLGSQLSWLGARPQLLVQGKGDRHDSDESSLAGKRMVLVNELEEGQVLDEGQVLRFVGPEGTTVSLRRMRQDREDHWITWKLIVTTNELPRTRTTPQVLGRLNVYPLSQVPVPDEEQYDIKAAIMTHEAQAVLAHLVKEWRAWYEAKYADLSPTGLIISDDMAEAKETYKTSNRPLELEFMDECTEKGAGIPVTSGSAFWAGFQQWMKREHPSVPRDQWPGRNAFYAAIRTLDGKDGVEVVQERMANGKFQFRGLRGIRLLPLTMSEMNQMKGF